MNTTKIYIVTPSYNAAATIGTTISSVLTQAGDFELYYHIQDGGSTDGTVEEVKKWKRIVDEGTFPHNCKGINLSFESRPDKGLYDAICSGFEHFVIADDSWMAWINADDLLVPGTCALFGVIDATPKERHIKWVVGTAGIIARDTIINTTNLPISTSIVADGLCDGRHWHFIQQEGVFFRYIVWKRVNVQRNFRPLKYAGDWNLWRCMAQEHRLYQVDRPLGLFRIREGQISQQFRQQYEQEATQLIPNGKRILALRRHASQGVERSVISLAYPSGELSFKNQKIKSEIENRLAQRLGPHHNADWQYPAETEKRVYLNVLDSLPARDDMVYFAFPWATVIDNISNGTFRKSKLEASFNECASKKHKAKLVVTACQHVSMLAHKDLFDAAGITHVFWSHATKFMRIWPGKRPISIFPLPLYPVQVTNAVAFEDNEAREHLFTFVGARATSWYLSEVRNWIIDHLSDDKRGFVVGRKDWHYNKIVYEHQIRGGNSIQENLVDKANSEQFRALLKQSTFALCPSGSGPNSIRLWEAIGAGAIPVIMADSYAPPGPSALWEEAAVFCEETEAAVRSLPDRLESIAQNPDEIARKRRALRQIWTLYGPDNFIHDIRRLYFGHPGQSSIEVSSAGADQAADPGVQKIKIYLLGRHGNRTPLSYQPYEPYFRRHVRMVSRIQDADVVVTGFDIDLKENKSAIRMALAQNPKIKFMVISEEPLWDTVWSKGFVEKSYKFEEDGLSFNYAVVNHFNSSVFDFERVPYFITTSDEYPSRYNWLFTRNAREQPQDIAQRWKEAPISAAFYLERRAEQRYSTRLDDIDVKGLSEYRTQIAGEFEGSNYLRVGMGWQEGVKRQALADWHLEKLTTLDRRCFLVSAIENTHYRNYVTEKVFDAFAVGAVPVYYASKQHSLSRLIHKGYVNLSGASAEEAVKVIRSTSSSVQFAKEWLEAQNELAALFSDPLLISGERQRVANEVLATIKNVVLGEWPQPSGLGLPELAVNATKGKANPELDNGERDSSADTVVVSEIQHDLGGTKEARFREAQGLVGSELTLRNSSTTTNEGGLIALRQSSDHQSCNEDTCPPARCSSAEITELFDDGAGYRHLNVRLTGIETGRNSLDFVYVKLQKIAEGMFGIEVSSADLDANTASCLNDIDLRLVDKVSVYLKAEQIDEPIWNVQPSEWSRKLVTSLAFCLPDVVPSIDHHSAAYSVDDWAPGLDLIRSWRRKSVAPSHKVGTERA